MASLLFVTLTAIGLILVLIIELDRRADERRNLNNLGTVVASSLERQLEASLSSTFILASLIRQSEDRMIRDFNSVAAELIETFGGIDSLQLAPQGIVSQIYPLEGNEQAIGHDLLNDPARRVESLKTIESGRLTLAGPLELVQGGTAVIGRLPVFLPGGQGGERFWGFTIALIRLSNLLAPTELALVAEQGHHYWLSRVNPDTGQPDVFASVAEGNIQDSVTFNIEVPNGSWTLHLRHSDNRSALWFALGICLAVIFSFIASLLVYTRLQRTAARQIAQEALDLEINERRRLEAAELELVKEISVVDEVARVITSTLDIQHVYGEFAQQLNQLVDFDRVAIAVVDQDAGTLEYKYRFGETVPGYGDGQNVLLEGTRTQEVLITGETLVAEDISDQTQFPSDPGFSNEGLLASIHTPLVYRGQVFGALNLRCKMVASYGPREQAIIERLASQIAPAVRNAQLYEQSKQVEKELRQSEGRAKALLESAPQGIIATSETGEIVQVNDAALEIFGYNREELLGQSVDMLIPQELQPGHAAHREFYFLEPKTRPMGMGRDLNGLRKDGNSVPLEIGLSFVPTESGSIALAFISDITDRRAAEEAERRWAEETSVMAEIGRVISSSLDINEVYESLGEEIRNLIPFDRFGMGLVDYTSGTMLPRWALGTDIPGRYTGDEVPLAGALAGEVVRTKSPIMLEAETEAHLKHRFELLLPNFRAGLRSFMAVPLLVHGAVIGVLWVESKKRGIYTQRHLELLERIGNQIAGAIANSQLYAQQKDAEERIKASLGEKEVLLKEINHRVKNNLQIISSLLNLQSREIQDEQTLRSFQVSQDRIKAMALVHEKLYQSDDLSRIDFGEYIKSLADDLRSSYGLGSQNVKLKIDVDEIRLGVDTAIPCGVIVNELVSNSLKHAFPGGRSGEIVISFREVDGQYTMVFKDDGVGIPEDLDISRPSSLGLTIVNALVGQLDGAIDIGRNGGSEICITFPAKQTKGE